MEKLGKFYFCICLMTKCTVSFLTNVISGIDTHVLLLLLMLLGFYTSVVNVACIRRNLYANKSFNCCLL